MTDAYAAASSWRTAEDARRTRNLARNGTADQLASWIDLLIADAPARLRSLVIFLACAIPANAPLEQLPGWVDDLPAQRAAAAAAETRRRPPP